MKKRFTFPIAILISFLFFSCGQNVSLVRRHYQSGYYVDVTQHNNKPEKHSIASPILEGIEPAISNKLNRNREREVDQVIISTDEGKKESKANKLVKAHSAIRSSENIAKVPALNSLLTEKSKIVKKVVINNRSILSNTDDSGGEFIWTIIGILILVWLISLLTGGWGLGWLIYIFLVIALILLLLRLLSLL